MKGGKRADITKKKEERREQGRKKGKAIFRKRGEMKEKEVREHREEMRKR